jgi:hypothetical protein
MHCSPPGTRAARPSPLFSTYDGLRGIPEQCRTHILAIELERGDLPTAASSAVWWLHAHTKDRHWSVDQDFREAWDTQVSEGGTLCIVPVHSQQRGRIFLPFADNDPQTTEMLAKILLLAKDRETKAPVIPEQIAGMTA